jgi:hypothetical protein
MIKNLFPDPESTTRKLDVFESAHTKGFEEKFKPNSYYSDLCMGFKEGGRILPIVYYDKGTRYYLTLSRVIELVEKKYFTKNYKFNPEVIICKLNEMTIL